MSDVRPYLVGDVVPVVLATQVFKVLLEQGSHLNDAICHSLDLAKPLFIQASIVEDLGSNAGTMDGRVRVQWSYENLELRVHSLLLFC